MISINILDIRRSSKVVIVIVVIIAMIITIIIITTTVTIIIIIIIGININLSLKLINRHNIILAIHEIRIVVVQCPLCHRRLCHMTIILPRLSVRVCS